MALSNLKLCVCFLITIINIDKKNIITDILIITNNNNNNNNNNNIYKIITIFTILIL